MLICRVDFALQPGNFRIRDARLLRTDIAGQGRQDRTEVKEFVLYTKKHVHQRGKRWNLKGKLSRRRPSQPDERVEFVHHAVTFYAQAVLRDPLPAHQAGFSPVAPARVDAVQVQLRFAKRALLVRHSLILPEPNRSNVRLEFSMNEKFDAIKRALSAERRSAPPVWRRQPVHTVYGGAHLFRPDTIRKLGDIALRTLKTYAPGALELAHAMGIDGAAGVIEQVYRRVEEKLPREPVEDFRVDFEDGYGVRSWAEEDAHAAETARHTVAAMEAGALPAFFGIRIKPLSAGSEDRALRTLDIFLGQLRGRLPQNFVVTLPKAVSPSEPRALADALDIIERESGLPAGAVKVEIMIESAAALADSEGRCPLLSMVQAARGRCTGAHFGPFDFTSSCGVTSKYQDLRHPLCDYARHVMQVALAGTDVFLSDGPTTVIPVPVHKNPASPEDFEENRRAVHAAWRLHFDNVWRALREGIYQGWDLHPAQLPARYAAVYLFFLSELPAASERLRNFVDNAARATMAGSVFDDAASAQGLLNLFLRAIHCGAIQEEEAPRLTGLSLEELRLGSFSAILRRRF